MPSREPRDLALCRKRIALEKRHRPSGSRVLPDRAPARTRPTTLTWVRWRTRFTRVLCFTAVGAAAACGQQSVAGTAPPAVATALTTPTGTPLHARLTTASAGGATGQALTANLGGVSYRGATGVWVGCEGTAASAVYLVGGEFSNLSGMLGLQPHTPPELRVRIQIIVDGTVKLTSNLRRDSQPQAISVPIAGARSITVVALKTSGECAPAPAPYGAIGAASLT